MSWAGDILTRLFQPCDLSYVFSCPAFLIPIHFLSQVLQPSCWFGSYPTPFQNISFLLMVARVHSRSLCRGMTAQGAIHSTWVTSLQPCLVKLAATVVTLGLVPVLMQRLLLSPACLPWLSVWQHSLSFLFLAFLFFRNCLRQYEESIPRKQAKLSLKLIPAILWGLIRWTLTILFQGEFLSHLAKGMLICLL